MSSTKREKNYSKWLIQCTFKCAIKKIHEWEINKNYQINVKDITKGNDIEYLIKFMLELTEKHSPKQHLSRKKQEVSKKTSLTKGILISGIQRKI